MHSTLFQIGDFTVHAFGLCLALGFLAGWNAAVYLYKAIRRNPDDLSGLVVTMMISGVLGGRVAYVLEHWTSEFKDNPMQIFRIDQGGLMFYGGLILAAIAASIYIRLKKENFFETADIIMTCLPIGQAFGRIGCFMHGCCHGAQASWGVCFPKGSPAWLLQVGEGQIPRTALSSLPVIPTQLFESGAAALLFLGLFFGAPKLRKYPGLATALYLDGYAIIRFCIEIMRGDVRMAVGIFSISQFISLCLMALSALVVLVNIKRWKNS